MTGLQIRISGLIVLLALLSGCARSPEARREKYIARGKALLQKRDYSRAILEFRNAAEATPKEAEPYYQIGVASEDAGDIRTAVAFFRKALDQNPRHAGAQLKLAQLMTATGDKEWLKNAEARLDALKQSTPTSPDVLNSLALTQLGLGETGKAVENLEQALATGPADLKSSILLAQAKLFQHDARGAEKVLKKACQAAPNSAGPRVILGELYLLEKKTGEAEAEFRHALKIDPKSGPALFQLANLQRSQGRKQEAEQTFERLASSGQDPYKPMHAEFLFEEGRRDEAIREFQRLANDNPGDRLARTRLIAAYRAVNRTADAQKVLDEALKNNSRDLDALLQRAELFLAARKFQQAEADLNQVLDLRPNSGEAHYIRAKLYQAQGQNLTYRQELSEGLRLNPYLLSIRVELAQSLIADKQAEAALEILNAAPGNQKEATAVLVERNWAYWMSGDLADMRKGIDQGLARERSSELMLQDGLLKLRTGNYSGARASLEEALKINPADARALSALNQSYVAQNQAGEGLRKVREYASREPNSAPVQLLLGNLLLVHGDREQARAAFLAAKAADPRSVDGDLSLVQLDILDGKTDDARKRLEAILSVDSSNKTAMLWLANVDAMKRNYDAALAQYRKAVEANPENAQALNNLAYALAEYDQKPDEALKYAQKAVELAPDKPEYRDTLGWIYYRKALYSSAITELESASSKGDDAVWKYHLAMAYIKAGDVKRGRAILQMSLKRNPNMAEAKAAQALLRDAK